MFLEASLKASLIVIPSYDGGTRLERMLPTLNIPPDMVVVLDQGSSDGSEAICRAAGVDVVQLGRPHTYAETCNIGADLARERGCEFLFVASNDIVVTTDVVRELLAELLADPMLGIVAPAQSIVDEQTGIRVLANRASWELDSLTLKHDFGIPTGNPGRLEADFCELTFAGIRLSAIAAIGFLDDRHGRNFADADFGHRLRRAGYSCAYLPHSRIQHWARSNPAEDPDLESMANSRQLFAGKVLGHYLHYAAYKWTEATSWNIINRYLHPYLRRFGLIKQGHPDLIFAHPDAPTYQYLYTVWETSLLPLPWRSFNASYKRVLAPSRWNVELFKANGFEDVHYVPLGVESDVFQPWGPVRRFHEGRTFLWFARNQYRKGLDVMLNAWHRFHRLRPDAQLILMGVGIIAAMPSRPERIRRWSNFQVGEYPQDGICVYEIVTPVDEASLAAIYRSVDFTVCSSRSEGFGFPVAESMACGTPAIFGLYGGTCDFFVKGALSFNGRPLAADYSDMGFGDVGDWWEPDGDQLVARLVEAQDMNDATYRELATRGVQLIRARFSWRNTCIGVRDALAAEPERSQV